MSTSKQYHVHTTIPASYAEWARKNKLKWNELLIKQIEIEMHKDPERIKEELENNEAEKERLLKDLKKAKKHNGDKKERIEAMHKGLMPTA